MQTRSVSSKRGVMARDNRIGRSSGPPLSPATSSGWVRAVSIASTFALCCTIAGCSGDDTVPDSLPDTPAYTGAGCLSRPPPEWLAVEIHDPPECADEETVGCLDIENAHLLRRQVSELRTWAELAWRRCGVVE